MKLTTDLIESAGAIIVDGSPLLGDVDIGGHDDCTVHFSWTDGDDDYCINIPFDSLETAEFHGSYWMVKDSFGDVVDLYLYSLVPITQA